MLGNLAVDRENSFVGTFFPSRKNREMPLPFIARLLGIVRVAWDEIERFWTLGSGRPEFESRCHHLLLVLCPGAGDFTVLRLISCLLSEDTQSFTVRVGRSIVRIKRDKFADVCSMRISPPHIHILSLSLYFSHLLPLVRPKSQTADFTRFTPPIL